MARRLTCPPPLLLLALLLLHLPSASRADLSFSDISGKYALVNGNLAFCEKGTSAEVSNQGNQVPQNGLTFDGITPLFLPFVLSESRGLPNSKSDVRAASGIVVVGALSFMQWQGLGFLNLNTLFMRPNADFRLLIPGFVTPFQFRRGVRYFVVWDKNGGCVYNHGVASPPQRTDPPSPPRTPSQTQTPDVGTPPAGQSGSNSKGSVPNDSSGAPKEEKDNGLNMWVWLGPIIGAVATIAAALITVFKCKRREAERNAALAPPPA